MERQDLIHDDGDRLLLIYPNFAVHDIAGISLRYFEPAEPESMQVTVQTLAPKNESAELLNRRLQNFLSFLGPGGFAHPDDIEAMESAQLSSIVIHASAQELEKVRIVYASRRSIARPRAGKRKGNK